MEAKLCFRLITVGLSLALAAARDAYFKSGGSLKLWPPDNSSVAITKIVWKHNGNLVVDWDGPTLDYYGMFNGRTTLNTTTGQLTISNMDKSYEGQYWVEVNSKEQSDRYNVRQIDEVPRPEITVGPLTCGTGSVNKCHLICKGNVSDQHLVTYSLKKGDREWEDMNSDTIVLTDDAETQHVKTFTCRMKNPVSEKESLPHDNPLFREIQEGSSYGWVACPILLVVCGLFGGLAVWKRHELMNRIQLICKKKEDSTSNPGVATPMMQGPETTSNHD